MIRRPAVLLLSLAALVTACSTLGSHPPKHLDLSGQWHLNESLSDDPMAVMRERHSPGGGGMHRQGGGMSGMGMPGGGYGGGNGGYGGGGGGGYGGRGHHGSGGSGQGGGGRHGQNNEFMIQPAKLSIQQGDEELKLIADGVPTDYEYGEKVVASVQSGAADRTSGWKGDAFVVKYNVKDGPTATRSYEINDGGKQLIVTTEVSGGRGGTVKLHTVYERDPGLKG